MFSHIANAMFVKGVVAYMPKLPEDNIFSYSKCYFPLKAFKKDRRPLKKALKRIETLRLQATPHGFHPKGSHIHRCSSSLRSSSRNMAPGKPLGHLKKDESTTPLFQSFCLVFLIVFLQSVYREATSFYSLFIVFIVFFIASIEK